jgi:hypothetical protein
MEFGTLRALTIFLGGVGTWSECGVVSDLASRPELGQGSLVGLVPRVPLPHSTNSGPRAHPR